MREVDWGWIFFILRRYLIIDFILAIIILKILELIADGIRYIAAKWIANRKR